MNRTSYRFRLAAVCLGLVALVFVQEPGRVAADSKLDLTIDPVGFMSRALHMWDPSAFFGNVQNQAYGYLWPVGPFFALLREAGLVAWSVQRLWWSVVLITGFLGFVLLARHLGVASPLARVLAGLGYVFSVRMVSELSTLSVEAWPMAVAPWILIPLVIGSRAGSPRRWAGLSAVAFLMTGAINAVASVAVLAPAAIYLATRQRARRTWSLAAWWLLGLTLASLWWAIALLLMGRYSPPFLDWIESSTVTTGQNDPTNVLRGATQWVPYLVNPTGPVWPAGWDLVTRPVPILASALLVLLGAGGLLRRSTPERAFLVITLSVGVVLTGMGHVGQSGIGSVGAYQIRELLDGALAPLRNVHKFQPVVTLPLMVGLAHTVQWAIRAGAARTRVPRGWLAGGALAGVLALLAGAAAPVVTGSLIGGRSHSELPDYWSEATTWLNERATGRALVVPGASFGVYQWGRTQDEPVQALGAQMWGVRDAVPLGSAGNTRLLDEIERYLETGTGSAGLTSALARAGVRWVVLRNDLNARASSAPYPAVVRQALEVAPGIDRTETFGPVLAPLETGDTVVDAGLRRAVPAIEVFAVAPDAQTTLGRVALRDASDLVRFSGSTEALVDLGASGLVGRAPAVAAGDPVPPGSDVREVITDTYRRAEANFGSVRNQYSQTLTPQDPLRSDRAVHDYYPVPPDGRRSEAQLQGAAAVTASSSGSSPFALRGRSPSAQPWAALDGDPQTAWVSGQFEPGVGQWWQIDFDEPTSLTSIDVQFLRDYRVGEEPAEVRITTEAAGFDVPVRQGGDDRQRIAVPRQPTGFLRIELAAVQGGGPGQGFGLAEVDIPQVQVDRPLVLPAGSADGGLVLSARSMGREGCVATDTAVVCDPQFAATGEERAGIDRWIDVAEPGTYRLTARLRPRPGSALDAYLAAPDNAVSVQASSQLASNPAVRGQAAADQQTRTTWIASPLDESPTLDVVLPSRQRVDGLELRTAQDAPASRPLELTVTADGTPQTVFTDDTGRVRLRPVRTDRLSIEFGTVNPVRSVESATGASRLLPVGVTELLVEGGPDRRMLQRPGAPVRVPCGFGPVLRIDGARSAITQVSSTAGDIIDGNLAEARGCGGSAVALPAGRHRVQMAPTAEWLVEDVVLLPEPSVSAAGSPPQPPRIERWDATERSVEVAADPRPRMLETTENFNEGWSAELSGVRLAPYRVDGWRQGFWVPAGEQGVVRLTYRPDTVYRAGLGIGAVAVLALLALVIAPAGGPHRPAVAAAPMRVARVAAPVLAAVWVGGWLGALGCGGAFLIARWSRADEGRLRPALLVYGLGGLAVPLVLQVLAPWPARLDLGAWYDAAAVTGPAMMLGVLALAGRTVERPTAEPVVRPAAN